jgi:signal transduction histidine kinase/CHASE2 domain-containing sensor protein
LLVGLVLLICEFLPVSSVSEKLDDLYFRLRPPQAPSSAVALVLIDDVSLARYGRWPWHRAQLAQLVRAVSANAPSAVGIDILLSEAQDETNDAELARAIKEAPNGVLASKISSASSGSLWVDPLPRFLAAAKGMGHVQAIIDYDGACRSIPLHEPSADGLRPAFALKLASLLHPQLTRVGAAGEQVGPGVERVAAGQSFLIDYRRQFAPGHVHEPFTVVSAADLLDGKKIPDLGGKAVLIGFGSVEVSDRLVTPVSDQLPMPGVEINANVTDMLLTGKALQRLGTVGQFLLVLFVSAASLWLVVRWPGKYGLLLLSGVLICGYISFFLVFLYLHRLISYGPVLVAGVFAAPLAQLENLLIVERQVTGRLLHLRHTIKPRYGQTQHSPVGPVKPDSPASQRLHWKLAALGELQAQLSSLYTFNQTLIETMREGLAVYGADGSLLFSNLTWTKFCERHSIDPNKLAAAATLGGGWSELADLPQDPAVWTEREALLGEELWLLRAGRLPWTSFTEAGAILLMAEDITARRQRDEARAEALSFVTHELRTPLLSIQGFSELLLRYPNSPASKEAPATIFRETNRLVAMINTYLEVLRLDSGARPLRCTATKIHGLVTHVEKVVQPLAASAHIAVKIEADTNDDLLVCDETLMAGALLNLVSNAIKYGVDGSEVGLRVTSDAEEVTFEVRNWGPAIPATELQHIFERFYRPARSESIPGWGLGLSFVRRICQQHGGRLQVTSDEVSGTTFAFVVPRSTSAPKPGHAGDAHATVDVTT